MNRNLDRLHDKYFIGRLIQENIFDKGFISLFRADDKFDTFNFNSDVYKCVQDTFISFDETDSEEFSIITIYQ